MTTPAPAWRRLEPDERRAEILGCARRLFAERNYDEVSMGDVADVVGVTRGLLYHYFPSKRALYLETIRHLTAELPAALRVDAEMAREELFTANADAYLDYAEEHREAWLGVLRGGVGRDREVEAILDDAREALVDRILINQTGSADGPPQARFVVRCLLGLIETATREWLEHGRASRDQVRQLMIQAVTGFTARA